MSDFPNASKMPGKNLESVKTSWPFAVVLRFVPSAPMRQDMPNRAELRCTNLRIALDVSSEYLLEGQDASVHERSDYIEHVRAQYGSRGAEEMARLLQENRALFAGGDLSEEAKDAFFRAVMGAYLACKREAQKTYGHHVQESDHAD